MTELAMGAVDDYLETLDAETRSAFERVVAVALEEAPDAEQATSYGMPALRLRGRPLLGLRAARRHLSVFPFSPAVVAAVAPRLTAFDVSKGTIRFTVERPLPDDVVRELARLRAAEIEP